MKLDRRTFVAASAAALAGCDGISNGIARGLAGDVPEGFARPEGGEVDPDFVFLQRTGFGPVPGDLERLRSMGREAYLEEQLHPERIDDLPCRALVDWRFDTLGMTPGNLFEFHRHVVEEELARATLIRAVASRRQLYEVMVEFWTDHLNVFQGKGDCAWLKTADDRDVVRKHALGRFRDLIRASALSPAMLVYLDGRSNRADQGRKPNENYARELLELHTLGVHGGYTQRDVMEVARCLTGWDLNDFWFRARVEFHPERHDDGEKTVLGATIPSGGGEKDLERVIDIVTAHPSTATHLATKLCRRFLADDPPAEAVRKTAATFTATRGDLRETVREVLTHLPLARPRLKRPFRYVVSALRGLAAPAKEHGALRRFLERMGQAPFQYPTPDGFPDEPTPWLGTMLWRWNFALRLATGRLETGLGVKERDPLALFPHLVGRTPDEREREAIRKGATAEEGLALVLASPAFQWH